MFDRVIFPKQNTPGGAELYALNEISVRAPAEDVWQLLVNARNWSSYFPPENRIAILGGGTELALGTQFTRVTVGFSMTCTVTECVPFHRLAWSTTVNDDATGAAAYHGWVVTPTADGCHLLTEETLKGAFFLEEIGRKNPGSLYRYHQDWVEMLASAAETQAAR